MFCCNSGKTFPGAAILTSHVSHTHVLKAPWTANKPLK